MKKRTLYLFPLFLIVFVWSCKKDPIQYTFKGRITQSPDLSPVSGADVSISQKIYQNGVATNNFTTVADLTTNSNGEYEVVFEREKVLDFKIEVEKEGYFYMSDVFGTADVSTENDNEYNYTIDPISWVHFDIYNLNPESWDELTLVLYNFRNGCTGCSTQDYYHFYQELDTNIYFKTTGGVYARFLYKDEFSGQTTTDSVYATPFDTVTYAFSY